MFTNRVTTPRYMIRSFVPEVDMSDGVAIVSGGMDSITMVYMLVKEFGLHPHLLSFDYGQRHSKELNYALWNAERLGLRWSLVDLTSITELIGSSALTSKLVSDVRGPAGAGPHPHEVVSHGEVREIEVPEGHYAQDNMAITVVPNRNMMMMSIGAAVVTSNRGHYLAAGMHAGDHFQYPDCRPVFVDSFAHTVEYANEGFLQKDFDVKTPFINQSKNDIAAMAYKYQVPLHRTWSCYKGGNIHCGRCGTCVERLEAIDSVVEAPSGWDGTSYEDTEFWKQAIAEGPKS
jgi:7-cyano-7-deazaguanine synthase